MADRLESDDALLRMQAHFEAIDQDAYDEIRSFMNSASNEDSTLRTVIRNFENALIVILGYL